MAHFPAKPTDKPISAKEMYRRTMERYPETMRILGDDVRPEDRQTRQAFRAEDTPSDLMAALAAQGIEAATAGKTTKIGLTEGESPVAKPCAQKGPRHAAD